MARILPPTRNRTKVLVSGTISAGAVSITLTSGQGALFPDPATEGEYRLVLYDASTYPDPTDDPDCEDVTVTAKSTDTLTVDPVVNNHTTIGVQYVMYLSFGKEQIDEIDDFLQDLTRAVTSITYTDGYATTITTPTRTYTLTYDQYGEVETVTTNDSPAVVYTIVRNREGQLQSITRA